MTQSSRRRPPPADRSIADGLIITAGGDITINVCCLPKAPHGRLTVFFGNTSISVTGDSPMAVTGPADAPATLFEVDWTDQFGNEATVDGDTRWASGDETIATVAVDPNDSTRATVTLIGQAQCTATADADIGQGVQEIVALLDLTVIAGTAVAGTIRPAAPPATP